MTRESTPRFVRWQSHTITQFGFVNNTVLVLTTAALGFGASKEPQEWTQAVWAGNGALLLSIVFALWCALNRLTDFRESARLARRKMNLAVRRERRRKNRKRGECSWCLLRLQLGTFAFGALALVIAAAP